MAQTEFERGFIAGVAATKEKAAIRLLDTYVEIPKPEKEA